MRQISLRDYPMNARRLVHCHVPQFRVPQKRGIFYRTRMRGLTNLQSAYTLSIYIN